MRLSSDTLGGGLVSFSSTLRDEGVEESLVMDWWLDMPQNDKANPAGKVTRDDVDRLNKRIDDLRAAAHPPLPSPAPESGWKAYRQVVIGAVIGSVITACLALSGTIMSGYFESRVDNRIDTKLKPLTEKVDNLHGAVSEIQGELKRISANQGLKDAASLPPAQLAKRLPNVLSDLETAKKSDAKPAGDTLNEIQSKLLQVDANAPGYWPLVFNLISYHSILITGLTSPPKPQASEMGNIRLSGGTSGVTGGYFRVFGEIDGVKFSNSWIEFDANRPATLKNVHFEHCVLIFVGFNLQNPDPATQRLGRQLLAANLEKFTVS